VSATLYVDCGGGEYTTIQAAVLAASEGDTLIIAPCTYSESVIVDGKNLVFQGGGADITELAWADTAASLVFRDLPDGPGATSVSDMAIKHPGSYGRAITVDAGVAILLRVRTDGYIICDPVIHSAEADIDAQDCDLDRVVIEDGSDAPSVLQDCTVDYLYATGGYDWQTGWSADARIEVVDSSIATLSAMGGNVAVHGGELDYGMAFGGTHNPLTLTLDEVTSKAVLCQGGGDITLAGSTFDTLWYYGDWPGHLDMDGCLVRVDMLLGSYDSALTHSTFGGTFTCSVAGSDSFTSNIFEHGFAEYNDAPAIFQNNCFGELPMIPSATFVDNIEADPLFCGPLDFSLQECSPCVGAAHDGGDIGAYGIGCECSSPVEHVTWGRLKAGYR
jgi:hypothetical protein